VGKKLLTGSSLNADQDFVNRLCLQFICLLFGLLIGQTVTNVEYHAGITLEEDIAGTNLVADVNSEVYLLVGQKFALSLRTIVGDGRRVSRQ
jgi:hypothetical protein